jgi:hypothetical protein
MRTNRHSKLIRVVLERSTLYDLPATVMHVEDLALVVMLGTNGDLRTIGRHLRVAWPLCKKRRTP